MALFWLSDAQWEAIAAHLPEKKTGPKRADDRVIVSGIVHVLISGCAWRDCPREYGPYMTVFNRFNRWRSRGTWDRVLAIVTAGGSLPLQAANHSKAGASITARIQTKNLQDHKRPPIINPNSPRPSRARIPIKHAISRQRSCAHSPRHTKANRSQPGSTQSSSGTWIRCSWMERISGFPKWRAHPMRL